MLHSRSQMLGQLAYFSSFSLPLFSPTPLLPTFSSCLVLTIFPPAPRVLGLLLPRFCLLLPFVLFCDC